MVCPLNLFLILIFFAAVSRQFNEKDVKIELGITVCSLSVPEQVSELDFILSPLESPVYDLKGPTYLTLNIEPMRPGPEWETETTNTFHNDKEFGVSAAVQCSTVQFPETGSGGGNLLVSRAAPRYTCMN